MSNKKREEQERAVIAANRRYQQGTDALDHAFSDMVGVNRTDTRCMDILLQRRRLSAGELAAAAGLSPGAVTTALDRLERAGYARRVRDAGDRRRVLAEPTERAEELAEYAYGPLRDMGTTLMQQLSDAELAVVTDFLEQGAELQLKRADELRAQLERQASRGA